MTRALQSALDKVIRDISPEGQFEIDFFEYINVFGEETARVIR
jgi:hypothetical protein